MFLLVWRDRVRRLATDLVVMRSSPATGHNTLCVGNTINFGLDTKVRWSILQWKDSLIASHLNYGILAWGIAAPRLEKLQKKAIRLITNSKYIAHTNPLFKRLQLLKIVDIFKLRILKFYYNLYNGLLPVHFNVFLDIITREPLRVLRNPLIHQPVLRTKYAECNLLFQLINVINSLKNDPCDTI